MSNHPESPAVRAVRDALDAFRQVDQRTGGGQKLSIADIEQAGHHFRRAWLNVTQIDTQADANALDERLSQDHARGWLERIARALLTVRLYRLAPCPQPPESAYQALRHYDERWTNRDDIDYLSDCLAQSLLVEADCPTELKRQLFDSLTELVERLSPLPALARCDPLSDPPSPDKGPSATLVRLEQLRRRYQGLLDPRQIGGKHDNRLAQHPGWVAALHQETPLAHRLLNDWRLLQGARRAARWRRRLTPFRTTRGRRYLWRHPGLVLTRCIALALALAASLAAWIWWFGLRP